MKSDLQTGAPQASQLRRLAAYLLPYRLRMAGATVALLFETAAAVVAPLLVVRMLEEAVRGGDAAALDRGMLLMMGAFLLQAAAHFVQSYQLGYIGERVVFDLRSALYQHVQYLQLGFHSANSVGNLTSRLSSDVTQMRAMLTNNVTQMLSQGLMLAGSVAILVRLHAHYAVLVLGLIAASMAIAGKLGKRIDEDSQSIQNRLAESTDAVEQGLQGIYVVKAFGREGHEVERYRGTMERMFSAALRLNSNRALLGSALEFLAWGFIGIVMWYGGREVIGGRLSLAMVTGFLFYGLNISTSVRALGDLFGQARAALGGASRVFEILDTAATVKDRPDAIAAPPIQGRLAFRGVRFAYDGRSAVLKGITLDIRPGEILALVGPSGAGKSTLCNMILRFYDPDAGGIELDGRDLRSLTQASLRAGIGIVPQETLLFGGTVRDNILYGRLDATEAEVVAAAQAANAHEFILKLPSGYDTLVGQRGTNLSGGQRQRIAIARALLKDPPILLLDEPTSALDNESEELVQNALHRLMQGRTTLIIAHRLSTIRAAHRIAVLDDGQVTELGTHEELMRQGALYAALYARQFRDLPQRAQPAPALSDALC
ncbi:ABC transporter ATP-binding protein [Massilia endophytica]|uniref:ABC transporter ATP-binding protein n=1 Tax=Massilia endophytica TaxID=2899220 RepID=UPI001E413EB4|nr:ABC transporter ATP-binding protein [Massilia endophytica]UGQ48161.1 ABC transporter ATP-binding protein/permease [Massilia endophytica]